MNDRLPSALAYAGALPFVFCALAPLIWGSDPLPLVGPADRAATLYGLAIASFLAGSHWGLYLEHGPAAPGNLFLASNAVVLTAFFAVLLASSGVSAAVLMLTFAYLLYVDVTLHQAALTPRSYLTMRWRVTLIVLIALAMVAWQPASGA
ncbi:MAG: DUF3429 domain-containing protein [Pseudomonadota bacterium]